jgi:group I intron endonuclease
MNIKNIKNNITPIVKYSNIEVDKSIIIRENKKKCGVFRLVNKINGKNYIGSSIDLSNNLIRYYSLSSKINVKGSIIIYRALLKYGYSNFSLEILEYCDINILREKEQYYIDLLRPEYNINKKYYKGA